MINVIMNVTMNAIMKNVMINGKMNVTMKILYKLVSLLYQKYVYKNYSVFDIFGIFIYMCFRSYINMSVYLFSYHINDNSKGAP